MAAQSTGFRQPGFLGRESSTQWLFELEQGVAAPAPHSRGASGGSPVSQASSSNAGGIALTGSSSVQIFSWFAAYAPVEHPPPRLPGARPRLSMAG